MRYIVRERLSGAVLDGGKEDASGVVINAETSFKAEELGAKQLGLPTSRVEVIPLGDTPQVIGRVGEGPIDPEELKDIMDRDVQVIPNSWEGV